MPTAADLCKISNYANRRQYELSNHLGNVMGVIGDHLTIVNDTTRYPSVFSLNDYYVFGATKRWSGSEGYRYGFNGKENDNEVKGEGRSIDFGSRIHDPRLGRFLSLDPLSVKYPGESNYAFVSNNPIIYVDPDGKDRELYIHIMSKDGKILSTQKIVDKGVYKAIWRETYGEMGYFTKHDYREDHYYYADQDKPYSKVINIDYVSGQEIGFGEYLSIKTAGLKEIVMPQLMIFGSSDSHGTNVKANTDRPVHSIDMKSDEPWSTISDLLDLKSISDLKGANLDKVPELINNILIDKPFVNNLILTSANSKSKEDKNTLRGNKSVDIIKYVDSTKYGTPDIIHTSSSTGTTPDTNFIYIQKNKKSNE